MTVAGWLHRSGPTTCWQSDFIVKSVNASTSTGKEDVLALYCTQEENRLLHEILRCQYMVWVIGLHLRAGRSRVMTFQRASLWLMDGSEQIRPLSTYVITALIQSQKRNVIRNVLHEKFVDNHPFPSSLWDLHPHTAESIGTYEELYKKVNGPVTTAVLQGLMAVSHCEACIRTGVNRMHRQELSQLGASEFFYDSLGIRVEHPPKSEDCILPKGYVLVADDAHDALWVCGILCAADDKLCWQVQANGKHDSSLVVAPKWALSMVIEIFSKCCPHIVVCHTLEDLRQSDDKLPRIVSTNLLRNNIASLESHTFDRIFYVDWLECIKTLPQKLLKSDVNVAICLTTDFQESAPQSKVFLKSQSLLLQIESMDTMNANSLAQTLQKSIIPLGKSNTHGNCKLVKYTVLAAPHNNDSASSRLLSKSSKPRSLMMRSLFGAIMQNKLVTRSINTTDDVSTFFQQSPDAPILTSFAQTSFSNPIDQCPICYEDAPDCVTACGHYFCRYCLEVVLKSTPPVCSLCKNPLDATKAVHVRSLTKVDDTHKGAFIEYLATVLNDEKKKLIIASFGEIHEKLARVLRAHGLDIVAWMGNGKQCHNAFEHFSRHTQSSILIDPSRMDMRWMRLSNIERIVVILPLENYWRESCCQISYAINSICTTQPYDVRFITRQMGNDQDCTFPYEPTCAHDLQRTCTCPFFMHIKTDA